MIDTKNFYVVTCVSNPARYASRLRLYQDFKRRVLAAGAKLLTVEAAFGDRSFDVTEPGDPWALRLRTWDEYWYKENLLNLGISRLPDDWEHVAWVDADVTFLRPDWVEETVHQLQHYMFVQMWQTAVDTGPSGEALTTFESLMASYKRGARYGGTGPEGYYYSGTAAPKGVVPWHPGFAWACRREAFDAVGGLLDRCISGAADHHMALSLIGLGGMSLPAGLTDGYRRYVLGWQANAERTIRRDVGYVPGTIIHHWHGKKSNRNYIGRWDILRKYRYDPGRDVRRDWQGLYQLVDDWTPRMVGMRDALRAYFRARNEDSIDL